MLLCGKNALLFQKNYRERDIGPPALNDLTRFAPNTEFLGDFLPEIYHPSLMVSAEKLALIQTLNIKLGSSYCVPNHQQMVNSFARDQLDVPMKLPPILLLSPLQS